MGRPKKVNIKKNLFCSLTHKFYIEYGKGMLFFGHSKLKPIDYVALFNIQEESADLTASIASSTVSQTKKTTSTTYYTSGKKSLMKHQFN